MNRILCSTGAIVGRPNGRNIRLLSDAVERLECDGYEFMMYESWYEKLDEIRCFMRTFPAPVPVLHVDKFVGELISHNNESDTKEAIRRFTVNCELAAELGAEKLVLHLWNGVGSDRNMAQTYETFAALHPISRQYGRILAVENVVCESSDPMDHLLMLSQMYPDIQFTFDTKMAAFHGQLDRLYEDASAPIRDRICHMHINDYGGGYMEWAKLQTLHIGDGNIDFGKLFAFLKKWGYAKSFTIESTSFREDGSVDFEKLNQSIQKIRNYLN